MAATEAQVSLLDAHLTDEERALLAECEELATEKFAPLAHAHEEAGGCHLRPWQIAAGQPGAYVHHREARLREQHPAEAGQVVSRGLRFGGDINHGHGRGTYMHRHPAR